MWRGEKQTWLVSVLLGDALANYLDNQIANNILVLEGTPYLHLGGHSALRRFYSVLQQHKRELFEHARVQYLPNKPFS